MKGEYVGAELFDFNTQEPYGLAPPPPPPALAEDFYANLAGMSPDNDKLASELIEEFEKDLAARSDWEQFVKMSMDALGVKVEEPRNYAFLQNACNAYDTTLLRALVSAFSTIMASLFPAKGPAGSKIYGTHTEASYRKASVIKSFLNSFLTTLDKGYYEDSQVLILYTILIGTGFRKVVQDSITNQPKARFVNALSLVVNPNTTNLLDATRITEIQYLTKREILTYQRMGYYQECEIGEADDDNLLTESVVKETIDQIDGLDKASENKTLFNVYEMKVQLVPSRVLGTEPQDDEIERPFVVTILGSNKKILNIKRNWKPGDETYTRIQHYVKYTYLPGLGLYGFGIFHLLGNNSKAATSALRQTIDAASLHNFPGGICKKGLRLETNDMGVGMTEFLQIDTKGAPIGDCVMQMPYREPSAALIELRMQLKQEAEELNATAELPIEEIGANAPVGTTLALLEVHAKMQSTVLRGFHAALSEELLLIYNLFKENMTDIPYIFRGDEQEMEISKKDMAAENILIIPVSDPNSLTTAHRILKNDAILRLASTAPQLYNLREVHYRMAQSMELDEIDKLMPPPPEPVALDPEMENVIILKNNPVKVEVNQDHKSHIFSHENFAKTLLLQGNVAAYIEVVSHTQVHKCIEMWREMQKEQMRPQFEYKMMIAIQHGVPPEIAQSQMEMELANYKFPTLSVEQQQQICMDMEVQNRVAAEDVAKKQAEMQQQQLAQQQQIDPIQVAMAEVEQKREAAHLKAQETKLKVENEAERAALEHAAELAAIQQRTEAAHLKADESKLKGETEVMKAHLQHEADMAKTESLRETAMDKNIVDLTIAGKPNPIK